MYRQIQPTAQFADLLLWYHTLLHIRGIQILTDYNRTFCFVLHGGLCKRRAVGRLIISHIENVRNRPGPRWGAIIPVTDNFWPRP